MDALQPQFGGRVDLLVGTHAAHHPPHARIERGLGVEVVVPDALPGALQGEVPAVLAFGKRRFGALLPVDVDRLDDGVLRRAVLLVANGRSLDQHPDRLAVLLPIAALGVIVVAVPVQQIPELRRRGVGIVGIDQGVDTHVHRLIDVVAEQIVEGAIGIEQAAVWTDKEGRNRSVVQDTAKQFLAVPEPKRAVSRACRHRHHRVT